MKHCRYLLADGSILEVMEGPDHWTPHDVEGTAILSGVEVNPHRHRIDLQTQEPVDYVPPDPQDGSVWDETQWRWVSLAEQNRFTQAAIEDLESKQLRAMREHALNKPGAQARLQQIDNQIAALRQQLKKAPGG